MSELRVEGVLFCPACERYFDLDCTVTALRAYAEAHALDHPDPETPGGPGQ